MVRVVFSISFRAALRGLMAFFATDMAFGACRMRDWFVRFVVGSSFSGFPSRIVRR